MSAKQNVVTYLNPNKVPNRDVLAKLLDIIHACDDDGTVQKLDTAYRTHKPDIQFRNDPNAASGAFYDYKDNIIIVKPEGDALVRADMFLFESFNCYHREDYRQLEKDFKSNPRMFFLDYGRRKSDTEGKVTFEYLSLIREVNRSRSNLAMAQQAIQTMKKNASIVSEDQMMASMRWTAHDPAGCGDMQFTTPRHYAFSKARDMTKMEAGDRIKHLITNAAVRDSNPRYGSRKLAAYQEMDQGLKFHKWWLDQWGQLQPDAKPTAFLSICEEANKAFPSKSLDPWRPITLADFQFDTGMELEARRLAKKSPLGRFPGWI